MAWNKVIPNTFNPILQESTLPIEKGKIMCLDLDLDFVYVWCYPELDK